MTAPSPGGRSPLKIAGIALIGVGVVAGVVGLVGLGGSGDGGASAAPTTSVEAAPTAPPAPPASSAPATPAPGPAQPGPGTSPFTPGAPGTPGSPGVPSGLPVAPDTGPTNGGQPVTDGGSAGTGGSSVGARPAVRVYNNSTIRGLAERAAEEFRNAGWTVSAVQNYSQGVIPATTVYYRPGTPEKAAADEMARRWGMRSEARFAGIQDATPGIIVIITRDFKAA